MTKNAFQIFITDKKEELPPLLKEASSIFREAFSDHYYTLYSKEMLLEIIAKEFGKEVLSAFNKLKPYAYKADLARYCISYLYGGWYAGNLSYHLKDRPKLKYRINDNSFKIGTIWVDVLNNIKSCNGILLKFEPYYESCLMGTK